MHDPARARFPGADVVLSGDVTERSVVGESRARAAFGLCPRSGSTAAHVVESLPGLAAIPVGDGIDRFARRLRP